MMTYGSVCSGIEAATVAWGPLGWKASWFAEIEPFPSAVLEHHYPNVTNFGDMTQLSGMVGSKLIEAPDVLVGGTPCQAFSIAGLRNSLDDDRGQLTLEFVRLANVIDTGRILYGKSSSIIVWENVPGVLNTKDNAFGNFLAALAGESEELQPPGGRWTNAGVVSGPQRTVAWRILDAQYFGVAQRRRRVFVVASARDDINPAEILFEFDGVRRDIAPSREAGETTPHDVAPSLTASGRGVARIGETRGQDPVVAIPYQEVSYCLNAGGMGRQDYETESFVMQCSEISPPVTTGAPFSKTGNATEPMINVAPCQTRTDKHAVAFSAKDYGADCTNELSPTLRAGGHDKSHSNSGNWMAVVQKKMQVRRLTPVECERLQGFPDNYTLLPYGVKQKIDSEVKSYYEHHLGRELSESEYRSFCGDGPRYKALGNSMAVPVMRWIGERIGSKT